MIYFFSETEFELQDQEIFADWLYACIDKFDFEAGNINYIFCDDSYLLKINQEHLQHDYYTDIITFDYTEDKTLQADIFISIDRIADNTHEYHSTFDQELARVMIHGLLHMMGYNDKSDKDKKFMRKAEDECVSLLFKNHIYIDESE